MRKTCYAVLLRSDASKWSSLPLKKPAKRAVNNDHAPIQEGTEQTTVKAFCTGGADVSLNNNGIRLFKPQKFTQGVIHHLIKSSALTVPVISLVYQQAALAVAS